MDLFTAIKERRSCRDFLEEPVEDGIIEKIIEAGIWAPSPLNSQPWEFIVITNGEVKENIYTESEACKKWAIEKSGWSWLGKYQIDFLKTAPVLIAVIGDSRKSGMDQFQKDGPVAYQHACAAAVQNMQLSAHALGYGALWFTLFDKPAMRKLLEIENEKTPLAIICLGKPSKQSQQTTRKDLEKKVKYIH